MPAIDTANILILATDGYERSELMVPLEKLGQQAKSVTVASLETGDIKSWDKSDWGDSVTAEIAVKDVNVDDYDALVLPGGVINPDTLRKDEATVSLIRDFVASGKTVGAICHGPWLLVEAGALRGRKATSYWSIKTDLLNAGATWRDEPVVTDKGIVTSRCPTDLSAFVSKIVEEVSEGPHNRAAA